MKKIEVDVQAKQPDNKIKELFADNLFVDLIQIVDINTLLTLEQSRKLDLAPSQLKTLTSSRELQRTKYSKKTTEFYATQKTNPTDD